MKNHTIPARKIAKRGINPYIITFTKNIDVGNFNPIYLKIQSVENTYS